MKLHTEENVDMDITHVGIRGHWIRPESEPGENCMAVLVDQYIETTFKQLYGGSGQRSSGISVFSTGASDAAEIKNPRKQTLSAVSGDFLCSCILDGFLRAESIFHDFRNR